MRRAYYYFMSAVLAIGTLSACTDELFQGTASDPSAGKISLSGEIEQVYLSRVNDGGFADGDVMGVYVVDYAGDTPGTLLTKGNRADNVEHTYNAANNKWNSAFDIYWRDKQTAIDVYGYYPKGTPDNVNDYPFTVQKDQSTEAAHGIMGGYEASDFLWGKVEKVGYSDRVIRLPMRHRMSSVRVSLVEGAGFNEGEWSTLTKSVLVQNVIRQANINLATGEITPTGSVEATGTIPYVKDGNFRAIVVPQSINVGTTLFSVTINGVPYKFSKSEAFTYMSGKMHNFTISINKKSPTGAYELKLVGESITAWENDDVSHEAKVKEYIVINSKAGHLKEALLVANKDPNKVRNLKITGEIDATDFVYMRDSMEVLEALNLKEVRIVKSDIKTHYGSGALQPRTYDDDIIPEGAMANKRSLLSLVLPDRLKIISAGAFTDCKNLTGSLIIPEGVVEIEIGAFNNCTSLSGSLSLPRSLRKIGTRGNVWWYGGTFFNCNFSCELVLNDEIEFIGERSFEGCKGLYGNLKLPTKLKFLGESAFKACKSITGNLEIPQGINIIHPRTFEESGFDGTLTLHNGITAIGENAFMSTHFKGELTLPQNLTVIAQNVFNGCDFSGKLVLPNKIREIGEKAFAYNWRLMGVLEIPEGVLSIGAGAFAKCSSLEGVIFPESMENIRYEASYNQDGGAFENCYGIGKIICKGNIPAYVQPGAFNGVAKDNFTLEVPESAIHQYQAAPEWKEFKRIAAHHELVCRPSVANALNTRATRRLVLNAEGEWELASKPEWCSLSQTAGTHKTELTLTIDAMPKGIAGGMRTGEVVFRLKGKNYTHKCTVTQYDYQYGEDEVLTLQKATKGNRGGINLVFVGDGFDGKDIAGGKYLQDVKDQVENFFGIEPYKTYRDYFNVYTAFPVSTETGIGTINSIRYARFETTFTGGVGLKCDYDALFQYVLDMKTTVTRDNLNETLVIVIPNSTDYGGICQMWADGSAIAFCPLSTYGYPFDTRGVIQHEAGGHGFGKLGDEYIYHNEFIDFCKCTCCGHVDAINWAKGLGWYDNLSLTGKMNQVPWKELIFHPNYSSYVDIFEGGFMHSRSVFRSEQNSCMNNDIPYYSAVSRMSIVKRIKRYAGETFSFDDFVANDKRSAETDIASRGVDLSSKWNVRHEHHVHIMKGSPLDGMRKRK